MFCPSCGSEMNNNTSFCRNCGYKIPAINNKKKKKSVFPLALLALLIIIGLAIYFGKDYLPFESINDIIDSAKNGFVKEENNSSESASSVIETSESLSNETMSTELSNPTSEIINNKMTILDAKTIKDYPKGTSINDMDVIEFGSYPLENTLDTEPIEWIVVDKYVNKALLVSKNVIDCKSYNDVYQDVTWETCTLRYWLNTEFYNRAFSDEEKSQISQTKLTNPNSGTYGTLGGNETMDNIFILSLAEVTDYFEKDSIKLGAKATGYSKEVLNGGGHLYYTRSSKEWHYGNANYWLRTPGYSQGYASHIGPDGSIAAVGEMVDSESFGVRPAMWVTVTK